MTLDDLTKEQLLYLIERTVLTSTNMVNLHRGGLAADPLYKSAVIRIYLDIIESLTDCEAASKINGRKKS